MIRAMMNMYLNKSTDSDSEKEQDKGVILPQSKQAPCKACEGFKSWTAGQKAKRTRHEEERREGEGGEECPADLERLGRHSWTLLHTVGATYPAERPTETQRKAVLDLFHSLSILFPCRLCADDFKEYIAINPPATLDRTSLELWLCNAHNHINLRTGKKPFDCNLVAQRWRDGWIDGRCNPPE